MLPKPLVTVCIPTFDYAHVVARAIKSVQAQTITNLECFIVDDGSTDDTKQVVLDVIKGDKRFTYIHQDNLGVAAARNKGVFSGTGRYVCCLDADDAIDPRFLAACVDKLEDDRSLGIAYTGLWYIKPDGSEGLSRWPDEFDYDQQLVGRNQIPTCNVARREVWERLGGQRSRYHMGGAGEEDGEMWTRAGAYGWKALKVTDAGLFIYSWLSGRVSGDKNHKVINYLAWHPWAKDLQHPFVSVATPATMHSHPVRQYDQPVISVIIPVGPGHNKDVVNALDSLDAQTHRQWEVIVGWDTEDEDNLDYLKTTYPHIKWATNTVGKGPGYTRNRCVELASAKLLLFLDADDWLYPEALEKMYQEWKQTGNIIYTHYVGKAYINPESLGDFGHRLLYYNEDTGETVLAHESARYDCEVAIRQPDLGGMYIWNLITSLTPKQYHYDIGGFDEDMESWEDWDYWIRMARAGKCFSLLDEQLVVYKFYSGNRRELGLLKYENLVEYLQDKYAKDDITMASSGCKGCSGRRQTAPQNQGARMAMQTQSMEDKDAVLVRLQDGNIGEHKIVGAGTGEQYGQRKSGDKFYVRLKDYEYMKNILHEVIEQKPEVAQETQPIAPPPAPVALQQQPQQQPQAAALVATAPPAPVKVEGVDEFFGHLDAVPATPAPPYSFEKIDGITIIHAQQLNAYGVHTLKELLEFGIKGLVTIKGIGPARARKILAYAKDNM